MEWIFTSDGPDSTRQLGNIIGRTVRGGELICLQGNLGAGKTILTQGIASGLEVKEWINSPTFNLIIEYEGRLPLYHMDLYRIDNPEMLFDIGFEEYIHGEGVAVIEWAEKAVPFIPEEHLLIRIESLEMDGDAETDSRRLHARASGDRHIELLKGMIEHAGLRD